MRYVLRYSLQRDAFAVIALVHTHHPMQNPHEHFINTAHTLKPLAVTDYPCSLSFASCMLWSTPGKPELVWHWRPLHSSINLHACGACPGASSEQRAGHPVITSARRREQQKHQRGAGSGWGTAFPQLDERSAAIVQSN
jgi:hypothetical protein